MFTLRRILLAALLLYVLFLRLDPGLEMILLLTRMSTFTLFTRHLNAICFLSFSVAFPSSFTWISKLLQIINQMWRTMFAPYHQALVQSQ